MIVIASSGTPAAASSRNIGVTRSSSGQSRLAPATAMQTDLAPVARSASAVDPTGCRSASLTAASGSASGATLDERATDAVTHPGGLTGHVPLPNGMSVIMVQLLVLSGRQRVGGRPRTGPALIRPS